MTGSGKRRGRKVERQGAGHADQIGAAARIVMLIWEIVWTLVREHVLKGTGPGHLL